MIAIIMKRRTLIIGAVGLAGMASVGWFAYRETSHKAPQANSQALRERPKLDPEMFFNASYPDRNQQMVGMKSLIGQPLVVNFWASWCVPCVKEMPMLDELAKEVPQAKVVGVAIDSATNVQTFLEKVPVSFPIYISGHAGIEVTKALGNEVMGLPFTAVFASDGTLVSSILGEVDPVALKKEILKLLAG